MTNGVIGPGDALVRRPLLLLDVDGVLNVLARDEADLKQWQDWYGGHAESGGVWWPILWSPAVIDQLRDWHEHGLVELQWLTTWGHDSNGELGKLLGLPTLQIAGTYEDDDISGGVTATAGAAHASVAPSAPDPLTGQWWKYDVVRRVLEAEPDRRVIWVDDELYGHDNPFRAWADSQQLLIAVGPDPRRGLSPEDLELIDRSLQSPAGRQHS